MTITAIISLRWKKSRNKWTENNRDYMPDIICTRKRVVRRIKILYESWEEWNIFFGVYEKILCWHSIWDLNYLKIATSNINFYLHFSSFSFTFTLFQCFFIYLYFISVYLFTFTLFQCFFIYFYIIVPPFHFNCLLIRK